MSAREEKLREFLKPRRTWRWNRGDTETYDAVEATMESLVWYRWSHAADGGRVEVARQSIVEFREDGAPPEMRAPSGVIRELHQWLGRA